MVKLISEATPIWVNIEYASFLFWATWTFNRRGNCGIPLIQLENSKVRDSLSVDLNPSLAIQVWSLHWLGLKLAHIAQAKLKLGQYLARLVKFHLLD